MDRPDFTKAYQEANLRETLAGRIVLTIGCDTQTDAELFADMNHNELKKVKESLDRLHRHKIDLADEILVLNPGGYVGESTKSEIDYAVRQDKKVRWWESPHVTTVD